MEEAGHGQQHVGQELLEATQPAGLLPCSVCQGPWPTPRKKESRVTRKQGVTQEAPATQEAVGGWDHILLWPCSPQWPLAEHPQEWEFSITGSTVKVLLEPLQRGCTGSGNSTVAWRRCAYGRHLAETVVWTMHCTRGLATWVNRLGSS